MDSAPTSYCSDTGESFRDRVCLRFLIESQNPDGGWGNRPKQSSVVEPTCWVLLALAQQQEREGFEQASKRGRDWLLAVQLADGSWPAFADQKEGCWVTALAGLALQLRGDAPRAVAKGFNWLCECRPREVSAWQRLRLLVSPAMIRQNNSLHGWSWTSSTSSWVEPTAYALILLHNAFRDVLPRRMAKRQQLAEAMLYDRMCLGGGWNSGNPMVYGTPGQPLVGPTVWALLALQRYRERVENQVSLDWLARTYDSIQGPGSLALAHICLETYGMPAPPLERALQTLHETNEFLQNIPVAAFAAIALDPARGWLHWTTQGGI